jgi:hypothetical protein
MENQEKPKEEKIAEIQLPKIPENAINRFCRENKDLLNVGSRAGIYVAMMIIIFLMAKIATMQQVEWAESHCSCMEWGGDVITLKNQPKIGINITNRMFETGGESDGRAIPG